ncbi:MAG: hypothetical protein KGI93_08170, partial [Acidobacteriota bacterium]|nr:hypothetical protein [Acidobacteriota bacterium]
MSDSIWKKELSFGRRRKDEDPPETPDSLRVKQLAFQQRLAEAAAVGAPAVPAAPLAPGREQPASVWKKEISFRRKRVEDEPIAEVVLPAVPAPRAEPAAAADFAPPAEIELPDLSAPAPTVRAASEPESIWKKEISFRRKPHEERPASPDGSPQEPPVSIWKKEITFRRKHDDGEKSESIWHREISFRRRQEWNKEIEALAEEALRDVDAAAAGTGPRVETWLAKPELPPEALPESEPRPAPMPAPAPAPVVRATAAVAAEPKVPFWKREIGGSKKAKGPQAEKSAPEADTSA